VLARLEAGCTAPVAAYATVAADNIMTLHAAVIAVDGSATLRATAAGPIDTAENLGMTVARALLDDGASSLLAAS
jgi:hydroxymethylbilane synthase